MEVRSTNSSHRDGAGRILIVEDEPAVRELFASILQERGYHVVSASTAEEAERLCVGQRIDGLVANIILPGGKSGAEFAVSLIRYNLPDR